MTMTKGLTPRRWRIEFSTDLTRGDAVLIPLGFLVEAAWPGSRWLGMIFRRKLTRMELDRVNVATWQEMQEPEPFMRSLFQEAWVGGPSGADDLAARFPAFSALRFGEESAAEVLLADDLRQAQVDAYSHLLGLADRLTPVLTAPVIKFAAKKLIVPDVETTTLQTSKAA